MNAAETLLVILLLLILTGAIAWVSSYAYTAWCRRRYVAEAAEIEYRLQAVASELARADQTASQYSPAAPAPYGPVAQDMQQRLHHAREGYEECSAAWDRLVRTAPPRPTALTDYLISFFWAQPSGWRRHLRAVAEMGAPVTALELQIAALQQSVGQIQGLPLGVAKRLRGVLGAIDRVTRACEALQQAGVHGDGLDALIVAAQTHRQTLAQLPDYFMQSSDEMVRIRATQEGTQEAWQRLSSVEKPVYDALRRAQDWQAMYTEAKNMVLTMQVEVSAAQQVLDELPAPIDARHEAAQFAELQQSCQLLETAWRAPEVHRLADLSNAATKQIVIVHEQADRLRAIRKMFEGLEQAVASNGAMLDRIRTIMEALAGAAVCPVRWEYSKATFEQLLSTHESIGDTARSRHAGQLEADLNKALDVGMQASTLEAHINDVRNRHRQLAALLNSPEVEQRERETWFHAGAALYAQVTSYAAENWPERDRIPSLKSDAALLLGMQQELSPLLTNQSVAEEALQAWIDRLSLYLRERRGLQARLLTIESTLHKIEQAEANARKDLSQALEALGRLDQNLPNVLNTETVVDAWNAVIDQWREGGRLMESLDERSTGRVRDKAASVSAWLEHCAEGVRRLAQVLEAEANAAYQQLRAQVEALVAIAPFEAEPGMVEAQALLNAVPARPAGGKNAAPDLAALVEQASAAFERQVSLSEAQEDLLERIVAQVEPRVTRLDEAHAAAWEKLQEVRALQRQIPHIKSLPLICDEAEQLEDSFKQAVAGLENMAANGRTAKSVAGQLDNLTQQFQYVANHGAKVQGDLEHDLVRLRGLWEQASQWMQQLKRYRDWQSQDAALSQAVAARLKDIDQRFADMQRRYKGRPLPLEHACDELDSLLRATRRDIEVAREDGIEVIPAHTIHMA